MNVSKDLPLPPLFLTVSSPPPTAPNACSTKNELELSTKANSFDTLVQGDVTIQDQESLQENVTSTNNTDTHSRRHRLASIGESIGNGITKLTRALTRSMTSINGELKSHFKPKSTDQSAFASASSNQESLFERRANAGGIRMDGKKRTSLGSFTKKSSDPHSKSDNGFVRRVKMASGQLFDNIEKFAKKRTASVKSKIPPAAEVHTISSPVVPPKDKEELDRGKRNLEITEIFQGKRKISQKFTSNYRLGDLLGDGAYGFVMTAIRVYDEKEVAVKFILRSKLSRDNWVRLSNGDHSSEMVPFEVFVLKTVKHENIISHVEHIIDDKYVILITELHGTEWGPDNPKLNPMDNPGIKLNSHHHELNLKDLSTVLDRTKPSISRKVIKRTSCDLFECIDAHSKITDTVGKRIFAQIVLAVHKLHLQNIVHRDLKDENIVIDEKYWVKLIDFGSASFIPKKSQDFFKKFNGTAHFASPEVANGQPYRGPEAEIWALGVLLYTIVFGENPFHNRTEILKGELKFPYPIDPELKNLIQIMLRYDPVERATIDQVIRHKWLDPGISEILYEIKRRKAINL